MLKLNNVSFKIKECYLDAFEDEGKLEIGLNITTFNSQFMEFSYAPKIESEILFSILKGSSIGWKKSLLRKICFNSTMNNDGEPNAILYLGEHLPIENLEVEIFETSNLEMKISLRGIVKCQLKGEVIEEVKIDLEHDLSFKCIWLGKSLNPNWDSELKDIVNINDFELLKDNNGVWQLKFMPQK